MISVGLAMVSASHGRLDLRWAALAMTWPGHGLGWLAKVWPLHGLVLPWTTPGTPWSGLPIVCSGLDLAWALLDIGWAGLG